MLINSIIQTKIVLAIAVSLSLAQGATKESDLRLQVARQWEQKGEFDKSVQELRLYLSEHPDSPEIYARIGGLRMKQGNFKLAGENYKIALANNPNLAIAREGLAQAYEKAGDKAAAAAERKKLPQAVTHTAGPKSEGVHMVKAPHTGQIAHTGQASHGASPSIDSEYSPALDSNASAGAQGIYTQKEFQEALDQYRKKQPEAVAGALRRSLSKLPGHPGTYYLGGVMRFENGEYAKALFNFKRSTEYPDRGFNAHFYMGRIYQRQEKFAEATAAYEKYLGLTQSKEGRKQAEKYLAQMGVGKPKEHEHPAEAAQGHSKPHAAAPAHSAPAVPAAAKATVLGQDGTFFFLIPDEMSPSGKKLLEAHALCKQEKYEKAVNTLKETIQNYGGSDNAEGAVLNLASVYVRMGLHESARDRIADYLASENGASLKYRGAAHYLTGLAHLGLKDGDKAEKAFLKIKEGAPASSGGSTSPSPSQEEIDYRLSQAGELMKDSKKWSGYLEKAYASAKDKARKALLAQQLGALHAKFGSLDKAMDQYRKSMTDCTDSTLVEVCAESQLRLADLAFRKKDWKDAMTQYRQFAGKNPNHGQMPWVQYQMANIHKLMNNFESALNGYKKVIDNYPESYWAAQAKWKREDTIWQKEYKEVLD